MNLHSSHPSICNVRHDYDSASRTSNPTFFGSNKHLFRGFTPPFLCSSPRCTRPVWQTSPRILFHAEEKRAHEHVQRTWERERLLGVRGAQFAHVARNPHIKPRDQCRADTSHGSRSSHNRSNCWCLSHALPRLPFHLRSTCVQPSLSDAR